MNRKIIIVVIVISVSIVGIMYYLFRGRISDTPIKVGILHSLTGTMAISEKSVVDAALMAIEEINGQGGLLGRKIEPIVVDGKSDWPTFALEAESLITEEKVSVVFGCWTSACRKTVKPVFEKYNHLLFYPVQYEGLESSPNIIYTGAAPNQQIIPAVKWSFDNLGKRFFLIGSDYVFPRTANEIIKYQIKALKGEVVGEEYLLLGSKDVEGIMQKIIEAKPDVILNTINGDSNIAFFEEFYKAKIFPKDMPIVSFSIAEDELHVFYNYLKSQYGTDEATHIIEEHITGHYASWNYFQSIDTKENKDFVQRFKKKYGQDRVTDDPMEAAYFGVYLWAQAVKDAGTDNVDEVRRTIKNQSLKAPGGMVYINSENSHTWKTVRIGKIRKDGQFDIVWSSEKPIRPIPYPKFRGRKDWEKFLQDLYEGWGGSWANPGKQ